MPQPNDDKAPLKGDQLSGLYPTPKTFEERRLEQEERDRRRLDRLPKHPALSSALRMYAVYVAFLVAMAFIPGWVSSEAQALSGVFFAFLVGMAWFGFMVWMAAGIVSTFQKLGRNPVVLFAAYGSVGAPIGYGLYVLLGTGPVLYAALTAVHFVLVYGITKLMLHQIVLR